MTALSEESGRSVVDIKNDVKTLAEEYQKNGDSIPLSYKKAYDKIGVYSENAEKKMKQSSEEARKEMEDDADDIGNSHKRNSEKASSSWKSAFSVMGNAASTGFKVFSAGVSAAATGISVLGVNALKNYADYEQLAGGAQLLFGDAYDYIESRSQEAYKNVQMSQSEYLEQVNGFATGLKVALGGNEQAAAELADRIINAEADIVAATGNSQEAIQNAFNGIMKSEYTMLDNLRLGITPTKEGFQEMIDMVNTWNAAQGKATDYQIDNLADAQSALLDYIEMQGMSGYASMEAAGTISGSISMMSAAWSDLLTGIADDEADFDALINNFVDSVVIAGENLLPRIEIVLSGVGQLIESLLPVIVARIPEIVSDILPDMMKSGVDMIVSLIDGVQKNLPELLGAGGDVLTTIIDGIIATLPSLANIAYELIVSFATWLTSRETLGNIINAGIELIVWLANALVENVSALVDAVPTIVSNLVMAIIDNLPALLEAAIEILIKLAYFLVENVFQLSASVPIIFDKLMSEFLKMDWAQIGSNIIDGIWNGISAGWNWLVGKVKEVASSLFGAAQDELDIHSPSRKFKWIGEMCIAGIDEPFENYDPYETLQNSMEANVGGLKVAFAGAYARNSEATPGIDYGMLGEQMKEAINGLGVYMDGESVGKVVSPTVQNEFDTFSTRRI